MKTATMFTVFWLQNAAQQPWQLLGKENIYGNFVPIFFFLQIEKFAHHFYKT